MHLVKRRRLFAQTTTHEKLAQEVQDIIEDPSKIKLNVARDLVESCYFPIVQSGGHYQLKVRLRLVHATRACVEGGNRDRVWW